MGTTYDEVMEEAMRARRPQRLPWVLLALAIVAGAVGAGILFRKYLAARSETAAIRAASSEAEQQLRRELGQARSARADLEARVEKLQAEGAALLTARDELSSSVKAKEDELARLRSTADELQQKLESEIAQGEVRLSQANGRLTLELVDRILFRSGEAGLSRRGADVLARVGAILARVDGKQIQVAGHTDEARISPRLRRRYATNWELSTARATNVVRFLEERAHVPPDRLVASGYGSFHPVASNATPGGRARNRRIEILLTPALYPARRADESAKPPIAAAVPAKPASGKSARP